MGDNMIGNIYAVPVEIAETGFIKIVADNSKTASLHAAWKYKAVVYDPINLEVTGEAFEVTQGELNQWTQRQN